MEIYHTRDTVTVILIVFCLAALGMAL